MASGMLFTPQCRPSPQLRDSERGQAGVTCGAAGLRCLSLPLIAGSSSALALLMLGSAEGKFSERIFPSNYFLYLPSPHFCHLMSVVLIPESRRGEAVSLWVSWVLCAGQTITPELARSKACFGVALCVKKAVVSDKSNNAGLLPHDGSARWVLELV